MSKESTKSSTANAGRRGSAEVNATAPRAPERTAATRRIARNEDQLPPPSLDDPWGNLHPARIWPD